jgi:MSHA biogenesis protein MshK
MAGGMKHIVLFMIALAMPAAEAWAQEALPDPTRPPAGWASGQAAMPEGYGGAMLQSVILPRRGKPAAVINGERVELGGKYGELRVVGISESEVILKGPAGEQVLKMVPEVEKRMRPDLRKNKATREGGP